jgi:hypothetical protein
MASSTLSPKIQRNSMFPTRCAQPPWRNKLATSRTGRAAGLRAACPVNWDGITLYAVIKRSIAPNDGSESQ